MKIYSDQQLTEELVETLPLGIVNLEGKRDLSPILMALDLLEE